MNAKHLITAAFTLAAAGSVFAQSGIPTPSAGAGLTRAEVIADYQRARADGELARNDWDYPVMPANPHPASRAQVREELYAAQKNGELNNADYDFAQPQMNTGSTLTREQVRAELERARQNGEISHTDVN